MGAKADHEFPDVALESLDDGQRQNDERHLMATPPSAMRTTGRAMPRPVGSTVIRRARNRTA